VREVHEAFSAQALRVLRDLPKQLGGFVIPDDKLTPNGGAAVRPLPDDLGPLEAMRSALGAVLTRAHRAPLQCASSPATSFSRLWWVVFE
jgi:hypothetical protein